jgi:hypothetical protein
MHIAQMWLLVLTVPALPPFVNFNADINSTIALAISILVA